MTEALTIWNREVFWNIFHHKKTVLARLGGVQTRLSLAHHGGLAKLEKKLMEEYQEILYQEEILWFQRSREEWITSGDRNTAYYHAAATVRRNRNMIKSLRMDTGDWISDADQLKLHVRDYYMQLFSCEVDILPNRVLDRTFPSISTEDWAAFDAAITMDEVHASVSDMEPFKALGPDGF